MDEFGYLSVIISIILGFAVTQLLQGIAQVINFRDRIRIYWPTMGWTVLLLLINIQAWWAMFGLRHRQDWTFLQFSVVLLETIFLYLLAALVIPGLPNDDEIVDLRVNYFRHSGWFFGCFAALLVASLLKNLVIISSLQSGFDLGFHVFGIAMAVIAVFNRSDRYHKALICVNLVVFVAYIAVLFAHLR